MPIPVLTHETTSVPTQSEYDDLVARVVALENSQPAQATDVIHAYRDFYDGTGAAGDQSGWLNAAILAGANDDKIVHIEPPQVVAGWQHYRCENPLEIWDNSQITGYPMIRTQIMFYDCPGVVPGDNSQNTTYVDLSGLYLRANVNASPYVGINFLRTSRSVVRDTYVEGFRVCGRVDGTPNADGSVSGAIMNLFERFTANQPGDADYWYGMQFTGSSGGETGKSHAGNIVRDSYLQGELILPNPPNGVTGCYFQAGRGNFLQNVNISGYQQGAYFNSPDCGWHQGYAQICDNMVRFSADATDCWATNIGITLDGSGQAVWDQSDGSNRYHVGSVKNI